MYRQLTRIQLIFAVRAIGLLWAGASGRSYTGEKQ